MAVLTNTMMQGTAAISDEDESYEIKKALRFDGIDDAMLSRSVTTDGNKRTWTFAVWLKRCKPGEKLVVFNANASGGWDGGLEFNSSDELQWYAGQDSATWLKTKRKFRDASAWFHVCVVYDTNNPEAAERLRLYINGRREEASELNDYSAAAANHIGAWNRVVTHYINAWNNGSHSHSYMSHIYHCDGLALSPAAFGSFDDSDNWNPKAFALPAPNDGTTWSDSVSGTHNSSNDKTKAFDGDLATKCTPGDGETMTFTPSSTITASSQIRCYIYHKGDSSWAVNGINQTGETNAADQWFTLSERTIETLTWSRTNSNNQTKIYAIEVDGVILRDDFTDPSKKINPNNGITWSTTGTATNYSNIANMFDGKIVKFTTTHGDNTMATGSANSTYTWDLGTDKITNIETIHLNVWPSSNQSGSNLVKINGTDVSADLLQYGEKWVWHEFSQFTEFEKLEIANNYWYIGGIAINGHVLIDGSFDNSFGLKLEDITNTHDLGKDTLKGAIADGNGGLPIYNTTDSNGDVKGSGNRDLANKANLVYALPGDVIDGDVSHSSDLRNSGTKKTTTANGNAALSTEQSRFYGKSIKLDGTGDYLSFGSSSDFAFGTGDFCIEMWVYLNSTANNTFWDSGSVNGNNNLAWWTDGSNHNIRCKGAGSESDLTVSLSNSGMQGNQWQHLALIRESDTLKLYVNGIRRGHVSNDGDITATTAQTGLLTGYSGTYDTNGWIQNIAVYKGSSRYTGNFQPPVPQQPFTVSNLITASSPVNDGTTWSDYLTSSTGGWNSGNVGSKMFNGSLGNYAQPSATNAHVTFTPPTAMTYSKIEVYQTAGDGFKVRLNSTGDWTEFPNANVDANEWTTVFTADPPASFTSFQYGTDSGVGGNWLYIAAMRVDDVKLVDGEGWKDRAIDSVLDTPTNYLPATGDTGKGGEVAGNYCTWNPVAVQASGHGGFKQGLLEVIASTDGSGKAGLGTLALPSTGKWYWEYEEIHRSAGANSGGGFVGVAENGAIDPTAASGNRPGETNSPSWGISINSFDARHAGNSDHADYLNGGTVPATTGVIGIAVDMDNDKMWMSYNNTWGNAGGTGNPATGANPAFSGEFSGKTILPCHSIAVDSGTGYIITNFGQRAFKYTAPSGFKCLCTSNFPDVFTGDSKNNPSHFFDIQTWEGTSTETAINGYKFGPDFIWIKSRSLNPTDHIVADQIRGGGVVLSPSVLYKQSDFGSPASWGSVKTFDSDGFTVQTGSSGYHRVGLDGHKYVSWAWDAGSAAATASTDGSITPSAQWVNATAGFSMSKWTGTEAAATVGHGLSTPPEFIMVKNIDDSLSWAVYHKDVGNTHALTLDTDVVGQDADSFWNDTTPTNTVFSIKNASRTNGPSDEMIAYAWTPIEGYSKFGSYIGNDSSTGTFQYCGFKPRWIMIKNSNGAYTKSWHIYDTARNPGNADMLYLLADSDYGGGTYEGAGDARPIDILSNGFKIRESDSNINTTITYIWAAFAEHPLKLTRAR